MFDGLLENMKEQEAAMQKKLQELKIEESLQGVTITGNANLEMDQITIDEALLNPGRKEELEELLVACFSSWKSKVEKEATAISSKLVDDIMPPGFDDLLKNFK